MYGFLIVLYIVESRMFSGNVFPEFVSNLGAFPKSFWLWELRAVIRLSILLINSFKMQALLILKL